MCMHKFSYENYCEQVIHKYMYMLQCACTCFTRVLLVLFQRPKSPYDELVLNRCLYAKIGRPRIVRVRSLRMMDVCCAVLLGHVQLQCAHRNVHVTLCLQHTHVYIAKTLSQWDFWSLLASSYQQEIYTCLEYHLALYTQGEPQCSGLVTQNQSSSATCACICIVYIDIKLIQHNG